MSAIVSPEQQTKYIEETLIGQLNWHDRKAATNQKMYKRLRIIVLIVSATIPFLSGLVRDEGMDYIPYLIGVAGIVVTVCEGLIILNKYQENWVDYRKVAEALRREKTYYEAGVGEYATPEEAFGKLVMRVGQILSHEVDNWTNRVNAQVDG